MRKLDCQETESPEALQAQLDAARDGLRNLDRNIRKMLGRDVSDGEGVPLQPPRLSQKRPLLEDRRRPTTDFVNNEIPGGKRRWQSSNTEPKTVFSRLSARVPSTADDSADEDDSVVKPAVSSRVIATPREIPSRQEVIRRERTDERSRQRNKRMFGALLGTLQKFRQEETKLKAKEDKKAEVEARVEEARRREKEELRKERQQLFLSRKRQLTMVQMLEAKLARSRQFQDWRGAQLPLASFIKTRAQPAIYYLPKRKHPQTDAWLAQSAKELYDEIEKREKELDKELKLIEAQIGLGKLSQNFEVSGPLHTAEAVPRSIEEGEENQDPNPENNTESAVNDDTDVPMQPMKKENFDDDHKTEETEDVKFHQVQSDENNG
ncbi:pinin [Pseudomyrmex gracilis]|uniref:pinin n=1 Tax=Pseudomyrmex gracilis TaxID=219809 RepID=UPI000994BFF6|nr:pinin [Pseudomyrmex gracilis]